MIDVAYTKGVSVDYDLTPLNQLTSIIQHKEPQTICIHLIAETRLAGGTNAITTPSPRATSIPGAGTSATPSWTTTYQYDDVGTRTKKMENGQSTLSAYNNP